MMKTYTFIFSFLVYLSAYAQNDTNKIIQRIPADTSLQKLNMDAVYNRPFLTAKKVPIAIGGYAEANTQYSETDGVSDGFSFQMRRFTLFLSSSVGKKIKFLSEIEFEDGAKEINLEYAAMDIEFHYLLNLRGGVIMNPIGGYNQNHDGPRWDFIDRPFSAISIIPSTLSNVGFGLHGKYFSHQWILGYEAYLSNGFDDQIISNADNITSLAAGKMNPSRFEEGNSGLPMFTGKVAIRNRKIGELGISYLSGVFNKWQSDGLILDSKRSVGILAIDFNTSILNNRINITGELAKVWVDVPNTYIQNYGKQQFGGFIDFVGTVFGGKIFAWEKAKVNVGLRLEYVDYNLEKFVETNENIGDQLWAILPGIAFRPTGSTVLRFNYRILQQTDFLNNPATNTGAIQLGFSTYF